jgi:hypothetical protein
MAAVVGIHGIAQQRSGPVRQLRLWSEAFERGLSYAGCPRSEAPTLAVPFYGSLFREGSPYLGEDDEQEWTDAEVLLIVSALNELTEDISKDEMDLIEQTARSLGPPAFLPPPLLRGLAAVDRKWGTGRAFLLIGVLRQVNAYLFNDEAGDQVRQMVTNEIEDDTRVLVGHSLGSVIAYDLLIRGAATQITTLITLGSPLPLATVRSALRAGRLVANDGPSWFNVHDPWDVVTVGLGMAPEARDIEVSNRISDPHALSEYLGRKETAKVILGGTPR